MDEYTFATDAASGTIEASDLQEALSKLDTAEHISDCLGDGAWAWVESKDGDRLYIGRENMR